MSDDEVSQNLPQWLLNDEPGKWDLLWKYSRWNRRRVESLVKGPWKETRSVGRWMLVRAFVVFGFLLTQVLWRDTSWALPFQLVIGAFAAVAITNQVIRMNTYRDGYIDGLREADEWVGTADSGAEVSMMISGRIRGLILGGVPGKGE